MSAIDDAGRAFSGLDNIEAAQVRRCVRALLRRPLLVAGGPGDDLLPLARRYRIRLQTFFSAYLGYRLVVDSRFARLYKTGPGDDPTRGVSQPGGAPFTPRAYSYLALTLAVLTGAGPQLLLSGLVADVRAAAVEAGVEVTDDLTERRALVAALRRLIALGVLTETDGSVAPWAEDTAAEALITVDVELLRHLVAGPLAPAATPEELLDLAAEPGPGGARHAVRRRLAEDPVVHYGRLPGDQADWLRNHLRREASLLEDYTGLRTEARGEGVIALDDEEHLSDLVFPGPSTVGRIAVLALPELVADPDTRSDDGHHLVTMTRLRRVCGSLATRYPQAWSKDAVADDDALAKQVARRLVVAGLGRVVTPDDGGDLLVLSPACHRYAPVPDAREPDDDEPDGPGISPDQEMLFADDLGAEPERGDR
ncbi:MAG TPA: TIGR02678 family protein [Streptosporangiaceae bacterium]|jgi:uncharacterized protein (TIGR02678 family)